MKFFILFTLILNSTLVVAANLDIQGHRGARAVLPENTLAGFEYALSVGVDTLELDMGVSKDNVVVVVHDQEINPTLCEYKDGRAIPHGLLIRQLTLAEIKAINCGTKRNPRFKKQTTLTTADIPTLADVFQLVSESTHPNAATVHFNIETKSNPLKPAAQPAPEEFTALVLAVIKQFNFESRVTLQSFDHRTLLAAKNQAPELTLAALFSEPPTDWVAATKAASADIVSPNHKHIDANSVKRIQAAGLKVIPWTANNTEDWRRLIDMGVDGIITDDPKPLLKLLERH